MRAASVPAQLNFVGRTDVPQRRIEEWHGTTGTFGDSSMLLMLSSRFYSFS